jgi:D-alanine transaminase
MRDAKVHVEDRGYQFADGVYEVCEVRGGRLIDERRHLERLKRSLGELRIRAPMSPRRSASCCAKWWRAIASATASSTCRSAAAWRGAITPFRRRNRAEPGGDRAQLNRARNEALAPKRGIAVISVPDNRWGRVDIKTVGLLPNVLARQAAIEQGARDAWFVDKDGAVTEAASANAWIVTATASSSRGTPITPSCAALPAPCC